jgi:pimeloyl-ACP methyl ester carboxylesterase
MKHLCVATLVGTWLLVACASPGNNDTAQTATSSETVDTLVNVGGHKLHARVVGSGEQTAVIEIGIGESDRVWGDVIAALAPSHRVVTYDRAGYGQSEPGPTPRDADRVAGELATLLEALPVEPPFVLAAHSLGATNALVYTVDHPERVAGLVILDMPPLGFITGERFPNLVEMAEQMTASFRRDAAGARDAGDTGTATFLETIASEHEAMFGTTARRLATIESLGDVPLVVMGSGVPNPQFGDSAASFQEFWRESSEALAELSSRGRFVFVEHSTHDLPGEATDAVVEAIRSVSR